MICLAWLLFLYIHPIDYTDPPPRLDLVEDRTRSYIAVQEPEIAGRRQEVPTTSRETPHPRLSGDDSLISKRACWHQEMQLPHTIRNYVRVAS
jgi:hypothetical protein